MSPSPKYLRVLTGNNTSFTNIKSEHRNSIAASLKSFTNSMNGLDNLKTFYTHLSTSSKPS